MYFSLKSFYLQYLSTLFYGCQVSHLSGIWLHIYGITGRNYETFPRSLGSGPANTIGCTSQLTGGLNDPLYIGLIPKGDVLMGRDPPTTHSSYILHLPLTARKPSNKVLGQFVYIRGTQKNIIPNLTQNKHITPAQKNI